MRFTPAYDPHVLVDRPDLARALMVDRCGLRMLPGQEVIPVVVDHDMDRRIGVVREMFTDTDTDGRRWNFASVTLDPNPPAWLKRGTGVSWGYNAFGTREAIWGSKTKHITDAFIEKISVLRMMNPAEKLAKVLWVGEIAESPAAGGPPIAAPPVRFISTTTATSRLRLRKRGGRLSIVCTRSTWQREDRAAGARPSWRRQCYRVR